MAKACQKGVWVFAFGSAQNHSPILRVRSTQKKAVHRLRARPVPKFTYPIPLVPFLFPRRRTGQGSHFLAAFICSSCVRKNQNASPAPTATIPVTMATAPPPAIAHCIWSSSCAAFTHLE